MKALVKVARGPGLELTEVHGAPEGDTFLPAFGPEWREASREDHDGYSFVTLERRPSASDVTRGG